MAHGTFHQTHHGTIHGTRSSIFVPVDPLAGVTRDSESLIYLPSDADEWDTLRDVASLVLPTPDHLWLMQEASGSVADVIGSKNLTATGGGAAPTYQKAAIGWDRKAIGGNGSAVNCNLSNTSMVNTATTSYIVFAVLTSATATALRTIIAYGTPLISQPVGSKYRLRMAASTADTVAIHSNQVRPVVFAVNHTATTIKLYTDLEKLSVTYAAPVGSTLTYQCSGTGDTTAADFLYACAWDGVEVSDADVKALFEAIGYTPPWS